MEKNAIAIDVTDNSIKLHVKYKFCVPNKIKKFCHSIRSKNELVFYVCLRPSRKHQKKLIASEMPNQVQTLSRVYLGSVKIPFSYLLKKN